MASATALAPSTRYDFKIAIICALSLEANCVQAVFDEFWKDYGKIAGDPNAYTAGSIGRHNVILAHMPGMGTVAAAAVAVGLRASFPGIKLALVVGICGGVPYGLDQKEIMLGDVIISQAIIQYDFGRQYPQDFKRKSSLEDTMGSLSPEIRALQAKLETYHAMQEMNEDITTSLAEIHGKLPDTKPPARDDDILYQSSYVHKHHTSTVCECRNGDHICSAALEMECEDLGCDTSMRISRKRLVSATRQPIVHFGIIGSGNSVMKSGQHRDHVSKVDGIIAFEMEGAGVRDYFPSIVIKGVCDYADSHKRKGWQRYAAATAAACMKAFLSQWPSEAKPNPAHPTLMLYSSCVNYIRRENHLRNIEAFFDGQENHQGILVVWGLGGVGKTQIVLGYAVSQSSALSIFWVRADKFENFLLDYRSILELLDKEAYLSVPENEPKTILATTLAALEKAPSEWLLILDNADDIEIFRGHFVQDVCLGDYIPQGGRVIITTRDVQFLGELAPTANGVEVRSMTQEEAKQLLLHSIPTGLQDNDSDRLDKCVLELSDELGCLPLAIAQAAANMRYLRTPLHSYVSLYREKKSRMELLSQPVHHPRLPPQSVLVTWQISFEHVQESSPLAAEILCYLGFLHWRSIPGSILRHLPGVDKLSKLKFSQVIAKLLHLSLVEMSEDDEFDLHPMVHYWISARLDLEGRRRYLKPLLDLFSVLFPVKYEEKAFSAYLLPHAREIIYQATDLETQNMPFARLMQLVANFLSNIGICDVSVRLIQRALEMGTAVCDIHDVSLIYLRKFQGRCLHRAAIYAAAASDYRKCLRDLPTVHASAKEIASERYYILRDLVSVLRAMYDYEAVAKAQEDLIAARAAFYQYEKPINDETPLAQIVDQHNRSHNLMRSGRLDEAEPLNDEVIRWSENEGKVLVSDQLYFTFLNCRGHILYGRARKKGALDIFRDVFYRSFKVLDKDDVDIYVAALNVIGTMFELKQYEEMDAEVQRILNITNLESLQGIKADKILHILNFYAVAEQKRGNYREAELFHIEVLKLCRRLMEVWRASRQGSDGKSSPTDHNFLDSSYHVYLYNLCLALARQGRLVEVQTLRSIHRHEMDKAEKEFGHIEDRLKHDQKVDRTYAEARQRLSNEGKGAIESRWWADNIVDIETAEHRLGRLLSANGTSLVVCEEEKVSPEDRRTDETTLARTDELNGESPSSPSAVITPVPPIQGRLNPGTRKTTTGNDKQDSQSNPSRFLKFFAGLRLPRAKAKLMVKGKRN